MATDRRWATSISSRTRASPWSPAIGLGALGSMTQGLLGSLICLALREQGSERDMDVVSVVTHVRIDPTDPAFHRPTKPIGPFFAAEAAGQLARQKGWRMVDDAGRGYRR